MSALDVHDDVEAGFRSPTSRVSIGIRLQAVMAELRPVGKDSKSEGGFTFKYRGIDAVINEVSPLFAKQGIIVSKSYSSSSYTSMTSSKGSELHRCSVNVVFRYASAHDVTDFIEDTVVAEAMDSGDKATAKAMSVALRTSLIQVLLIPTGEADPDADQYETRRIAPAPTRETPAGRDNSWSERAWNGMVQATNPDREVTHLGDGVEIVADQFKTAPDDMIPFCDHGQMVRKSGNAKASGKPYFGYVCTSTPQCPPAWYEIDKASGFWKPRA